MIISVSRRTDIPAFYSDWFFRRLDEGFVMTRNPFNHSQVRRVSLLPEDVDCFVFWTKDPAPMLERLRVLDERGYPYYFLFTLTPYGNDLELNLRPKEAITRTFKQLSERIGNRRVIWRYDPIILNNKIGISYHIREFHRYCKLLVGFTDNVIISFVDMYSKIKSDKIREITSDEMRELSLGLSHIEGEHGLSIRSCCEDLTVCGVRPAPCIDGELIRQITGKSFKLKQDPGQRPHCGCMQSVDIGVYNTCGNGCVYCYANYSPASVKKNMLKHDPAEEFLLP